MENINSQIIKYKTLFDNTENEQLKKQYKTMINVYLRKYNKIIEAKKKKNIKLLNELKSLNLDLDLSKLEDFTNSLKKIEI